jgi:uncharacterized membrane protein YkvA (DUF1232 family)
LVGRFPEASSDSCVGTFLIGNANFIFGTVFSRVLSGVQRVARMPIERSEEIVRLFKRELIVYQRVLQDERPPRSAKLLRALATSYLCMPFD